MTRVRALSVRDAVVAFVSVLTAAAYVYVILVAASPHPLPSPVFPRAPELIERIGGVIVPTKPTTEPRTDERPDRPEAAAVVSDGDGTLSSAAALRVAVTPSPAATGELAVARGEGELAPAADRRAESPPQVAVGDATRPGKVKQSAEARDSQEQRGGKKVRHSAKRDRLVVAVVERSSAPAKRGAAAPPHRRQDAGAPGKPDSRTKDAHQSSAQKGDGGANRPAKRDKGGPGKPDSRTKDAHHSSAQKGDGGANHPVKRDKRR